MRVVATAIDRASEVTARITRVLVVTLTLVMTVILFVQVALRYGTGVSLTWSEEAALTIFAWVVLLAGSLGVREGFHVRIAALVGVLPPLAREHLERALSLVVLIFGVALTYAGYLYCRDSVGQVSAGIGYPINILHSAAPVTGFLICIHAFSWVLRREPK